MSVINNMLKDLEIRTSQFTPIEIASVKSATVHKTEQTNPLVFALIVVLLAGGITLLYFKLTYNRTEETKAVEEITEASQPVKPIAIPIVTTGNQIIGLQIKESADSLSLEFSLREKVVSYLKERSENKFVYYLKDIRSEIVAPLIKDNRWIKQLSISAYDAGIDITFRTAEGVLVETRQQLQDSEQIWAIKLKTPLQPIALLRPARAKLDPAAKQPVKKQARDSSAQVVEAKAEPPTEPNIEAREVKVEINSSRPETRASEQLQRAVNLLKIRRWGESVKLLEGLINGPQDITARKHLLGIFGQNGLDDRFSTLARESMERYPQQGLFKTEYARSLFKLNAYRRAIEFLRNLDNADATQLALLAASYQRLDQHLQSIRYYKVSLDKDGRQAKNWIGLGISQEQSAQPENALRSYRTALKLGDINGRLQTFVEKRSKQLEQALN